MEQINDLLKPMDSYEKVSKIFEQNVEELFTDLTKQSNVDVAANAATCQIIYKKQKEKNNETKRKKGLAVAKGFSIAGAVISFICMVVAILSVALTNPRGIVSIILIPVGAVFGIGFVLLICLLINKSINNSKSKIAMIDDEIDKNTKEARKQMKPLNDLWTWNMPQYLFNQLFSSNIKSEPPFIHLDRVLTPRRYAHLVEKYGLDDYLFDKNESVISVQSGEIRGNPFVFVKTLYMEMGEYVYTGTLPVSWTTTERDSNGHTRIVTHTQILTAHLTKPKPYYNDDVQLIFGSDVAPDLIFYRTPSKIDAGKISDKKLRKIVKKTGKKLDKKTQKDLTDNDPNTNFVKMANEEFETLFNCTNRNNETQFRVLFTALAQSNFIELFKKSPYGDDFIFTKSNKINIIRSQHTSDFDFDASPTIFFHFDYEEIHYKFSYYCLNYFQSIYFDLAPLLSIPLYQNIQADTYGYNSKYFNTTFHEVESLCNYFGQENFCHKETDSETILKCSHIKKDGPIDDVVIKAYSFKTKSHVAFIPKVAGNGRVYNVPVEWIEYIPVSKATKLKTYDFEGYQEVSKDKKVDFFKEFNLKDLYNQKGLGISR